MILSLFGIWAIGFVIIAIVAWGVITSEPTAHGQEILLGYGCMAAVFWPLIVLYAIVVAPFAFITWLCGREGKS